MSANVDDNVDGIIVYYPVLNDIRDQKIKDLIDPSKDVEGLNSTLMSNKSEGYPIISISRQRKIFPVTPLAVVEILQYLELYDFDMPDGSRLSRLSITIINRSEVVGKPLAALLAHEGAYVYSVDVTGVQTLRQVLGLPTKLKFCDEAMTLDDCLALSDVIISGVPGNEFKVPLQSLKDDCICVNFSSEKVSI